MISSSRTFANVLDATKKYQEMENNNKSQLSWDTSCTLWLWITRSNTQSYAKWDLEAVHHA